MRITHFAKCRLLTFALANGLGHTGNKLGVLSWRLLEGSVLGVSLSFLAELREFLQGRAKSSVLGPQFGVLGMSQSLEFDDLSTSRFQFCLKCLKLGHFCDGGLGELAEFTGHRESEATEHQDGRSCDPEQGACPMHCSSCFNN